MIDHSPAGSWAEVLPYCTQITVLPDAETFSVKLKRNLALRRAARAEANPHKRGHITRRINRGLS